MSKKFHDFAVSWFHRQNGVLPMRKEGYYSSGQFAALANVSVRTIRFYDRQNLLKPSYVNENGARFYTDADLVHIQQILLLKYLGFSLEDIRELTIGDSDPSFLLNSLHLQRRLVDDRIEQLSLVREAISDTASVIEQGKQVDWRGMLDLIHLTGMENTLASQYRNATNISARIRLHSLYSTNKTGWFPWLFSLADIRPGMRILEIGCGSGSFWTENRERIPDSVFITLSDISAGMIRDARRSIGEHDRRFSFVECDCMHLPFPDASFDLVIANHVLFYAADPEGACRECARVLRHAGALLCSTYGKEHMQEVTALVEEFDSRITLSGEKLFERFGLENGQKILSDIFETAVLEEYADSLLVDAPGPLIEYILSCHGNQSRYITDHYKEFRSFVQKKTEHGFHITKKAGAFRCRL